MNNTKKSLLVTLGAALLVAVILLGWRFYTLNQPVKNTFSSENVELKREASFFSGKPQLPEEFPKDIPVEVENLTQSDVLVYPDRNATLYSISFTSTKTIDELSKIYTSYFNSAPYTLHLDTFGKRIGRSYKFAGTSQPKDLTVMVTPQAAGPVVVQMSYLVRN
jgi:hypothetical protein